MSPNSKKIPRRTQIPLSKNPEYIQTKADRHRARTTPRSAKINRYAKRRYARLGRQQMQRAGGFTQLRRLAAKAQHLAVGAQHEEHSGQNRALQHCARNRLQRFARLSAQRGRASNPTKLNIDSTSAGPSAEMRDALQPELIHIELEAKRKIITASTIRIKLTETTSIHSINSAESFTSRYAIHPATPHTNNQRQQRRRRPVEELLRQHPGVIECSAGHRSARCDIRQQQSPCRNHAQAGGSVSAAYV